MFNGLLLFHKLMGWALLLSAGFALYRTLSGWFGGKPWDRTDQIAGIIYISLADVQLVAGLVLYLFFSPLTGMAFRNFSLVIENDTVRFYAIEHLVLMFAAVVAMHIGWHKAGRNPDPAMKFRFSGWYFLFAFILILAGMPCGRWLF